ncbi:RNA polymerase sigma factor [Leucobacter sp. M11]|uniref:RNA polymerase sigma factor n=1 Tax=Leucobacter sp. M11 TaxID=2993565 RepID=UPI002D808445|nr:sigma-70 family RNA polymerase sigma factor [Leucobacter sp. M11]MEB4615180.1 sigma-70 family RNA polymerase sigma factor [Leucobacter sp. M11]
MTLDSEIIRASWDLPGRFGELFDRHAAHVHRYAHRRAGAAAADDIVSETFLQAFDARFRYDLDRDDALPWLFGIATNVLRRYHRTEAKILRQEARQRSSATGTEPFLRAEERSDARERVRPLLRELRALSRDDRDTLLLSAWGNLSTAEIAEALGVPVGTVKSRLHRVRTRIAAAEARGIARQLNALPDPGEPPGGPQPWPGGSPSEPTSPPVRGEEQRHVRFTHPATVT